MLSGPEGVSSMRVNSTILVLASVAVSIYAVAARVITEGEVVWLVAALLGAAMGGKVMQKRSEGQQS
jgi:hypothetical protein